MRRVLIAVVLFGCAPVTPTSAVTTQSYTAVASTRSDDCHRDIPDCAAACALRETNHFEHIDWFDRRCAAVVLGRNPDKAAGCIPSALPLEGADVAAPHKLDDLAGNPYR